MQLYKSAKEIEKAGICHRNTVPAWIKSGKIEKVTSHHEYKKWHRFLGYVVLSEILILIK
jgi:hypothetical protein